MTSPYPDDLGPRDYDAELDAILDANMAGILTRLQARLDPETALADIHARLRRQPPAPERNDLGAENANTASPEAVTGSEALQAVCDRIDAFDFYLRTVLESAEEDPFAGAAFLANARPAMGRLRSGLANRNITRGNAERVLDDVRQNLDQSDRILQAQGSTLDDTLNIRARGQTASYGPISSQMRRLREQVLRLFEGSDQDAVLEPTR